MTKNINIIESTVFDLFVIIACKEVIKCISKKDIKEHGDEICQQISYDCLLIAEEVFKKK